MRGMQEGIEYNDIGTIDVSFDGTVYHLTRPKMRQWRYFTHRIQQMTEDTQTRLNELSERAAEATTAYESDQNPDTKSAMDHAVEELEAFAATPFYETSSELVREIFEQLSDKPLPEELDDWPVWLAADVSLPGAILAHWRKAPKVSGAAPPS